MSDFYKFKVNKINGKEIELSEYKNKVVLVVNVASKCGFVKQYENLENMYQKYKDQGLVILGFPCNQFFFQEPKTNQEILSFCTTKYNVTFDMFEKINVNGKEANPLYTWLKEQMPWTARAKNVKWNFEKFLLDKNGNVKYRFESKKIPEEFEQEVVNLINE
ncbi:glutathione peroxidase [Malacoplasma penetrans]|nr:redoxin domain-containing protein [Malacoplasma penetrans]RXY96504.1 glutathione peroxidase [Malacoplasma penetrans]